MGQSQQPKWLNIIQEFSIPLIAGVICAVIAANADEHAYHALVDYHLFGWEFPGTRSQFTVDQRHLHGLLLRYCSQGDYGNPCYRVGH